MSCKIEFTDCICGITFQLNCVGPEGPQGPAGETNDGANVGLGEGNVYRGKTGATLDFKTLKAGSGVVISDLIDEVQIDATGAGGGEANTTSNAGVGGVGLALPKAGVNLPFKNVNAGSAKVTVTDDLVNDEVDIDVDEAQFAHMQITSGNPHGTSAADVGAEPADATILKQADVDDIPVNGATTVPPSSNWAFDHENNFDLHVTANQNAALDAATNPSALNAFATIADVTFETLDAAGDVGPGATQVAQGDHLHDGVYEPADATILKEADVDNIPVNGALVDPISSNWAFDHIAAANPHTSYAFKTTIIGTSEGIQGGGDLSDNRQFRLNINGLPQESNPVGAADFVAIYDGSGLNHKKLLLQDLPVPVPALAFTDLTDTESNYIGHQGKVVKVNGTENGLIFENESGGGHTIQDEGVALPQQRPNLNFTGATVQATDNAGGNRTDVTITAIDASGVTFEALDTNGDVGTGANQLAQGNHLHPGVYDSAGSAAVVQSDLDNHKLVVNAHGVTPANIGATEEAPQDGLKYSRQNAAWIESPQTPVGGLSVNYRFSTATSATNPGSGNVKVNNADMALATEIYVSTTTRLGNPVNPVLQSWGTSDYFNLRDALNNKGAAYQITAPPTDNGGWFTFPVAALEGVDGPIVDSRDVIISQIYTPSSRVPRGGTTGQVLEKTGAGDFVMDWADPSGEANLGANVGVGDASVFRDKIGATLNFKRLVQGTGVILTDGPDTIQIDATGVGGGEANLAANVGTGEGNVFRDKTGVTLNLKTLKQGQGVTITDNADDVTISATAGGHVIQDEGIGLTQRTNLNFIGATVQATDNLANDATDVTVTAIDASGVTYENLSANGDVGVGPNQVAAGDHLHDGVYEPADATILKQADVDDTPVNGAVQFPISSNWAFDHVAAADPHTQYAQNSVTVTGGSGISGGGDLSTNRVLDLDINGLATQITPTEAQDYLAIYDAGLTANRKVLLSNMPYLKGSDVDDVPVNGATTVPISSNWAFDHNADPKHMPAGGTVGQYIRKQGALDYDVLWENLKIADDPAPILGGQLDTDNNEIVLSNVSSIVQGAIGIDSSNVSVYFAHVTSTGYDPADGGILASPGKVGLHGSVVEVPSMAGAESRNVQVSEDGILYAAPLSQPGWEVSDTSTFNYSFGNDKTQGPWVEVVGLEVNPVADVDVGDRVDVYVELYVENTEDKAGTIEIGVGINGADPLVVGASVSVGPEALTYVPVSWSTTSHGGLTTTDRLDVFARRGVSVDDASLHLRGTTSQHEMIVSIPGGGGTGGSPTDLGNIPGPSSVTITSSTGANTVVAGAMSGTAGMMTGAQVDTLASRIAATDVTYENLNNNGDVGVGADQVAQGNHLHGGVYEPDLGNPTTDGYVLSSTVAGARSWVAQSGGGIPEPADNAEGYLRRGATSNDWVAGIKKFVQPSQPIMDDGDFWFDTT